MRLGSAAIACWYLAMASSMRPRSRRAWASASSPVAGDPGLPLFSAALPALPASASAGAAAGAGAGRLLGRRGAAAAAQLRDRGARVLDPFLRRGLLLERDVLLQRLDRGQLVAGVAQAQSKAVVGFGLVGFQQRVPTVGGDGGRALAHAPAHDGQRVPGLRVTGIGGDGRLELLRRLRQLLGRHQRLAFGERRLGSGRRGVHRSGHRHQHGDVIEKWRRDGTESIVNEITGNLDKAYRWSNVCEGMISVIGSLVMGTFAWGLFWATISLGGQRTSSTPKS